MYRFFKYIICFSFFLNPLLSLSQDGNKRDSLLLVLDMEQADTSKIFIYTQLAKEYQFVNLDSSYYFANEGLILAKELNFFHGLAETYASLGDIEVIKDNLDLARELYLKSINFFRIN